MSEWLRKKILELIGDDLERIANQAYNDGCYVTSRQRQDEEVIRLQALMAENEKLREIMANHVAVTMPKVVSDIEHLSNKRD